MTPTLAGIKISVPSWVREVLEGHWLVKLREQQWYWASHVALVVRNPLQCRRCKRCGFDPWAGKIPGEGNGNPLQYTCLENDHGQRSLAGYSPWSRKESDMPEVAERMVVGSGKECPYS